MISQTTFRACVLTAFREKVEPGIDAVFVCVLDEMHEEVICGIAGLGVHIMCEKPLSTRLQSCINIYKTLNDASGGTAEANADDEKEEKIFGIGHVLRYSPHNMMLRNLVVDKEIIGDVLSIEHVEPVGWWHFSHVCPPPLQKYICGFILPSIELCEGKLAQRVQNSTIASH